MQREGYNLNMNLERATAESSIVKINLEIWVKVQDVLSSQTVNVGTGFPVTSSNKV